MNSRTLAFLEYAVALLVVFSSHAEAQQLDVPPGAGGATACIAGRPDMEIAPDIPPGSVAWVALTVHEVSHIVQIYRSGGCVPYEARLWLDDHTRGHPYRLQTEAEAYCAERAAGFFRGDGTLRHVALILSDGPLYREWGWSERDALAVLERVCG